MKVSTSYSFHRLFRLAANRPALFITMMSPCGREMGREIALLHDAVDGMQGVRVELVRRRSLELRPIHFAVLDQAKFGIDGEVRQPVTRQDDPGTSASAVA